jgi:hypothetical protein
MPKFYPKIDEKNLKLVLQLQSEDPEYLKSDECPYSEELKRLFQMNNPSADFSDVEINLDELTSEENILSEIQVLYGQLKHFGQSMRESDTASEKNTYFKLSATLLEKLISMRERVVNIQKMQLFSDTVLQILEDEVPVDARTNIIQKLKKVVDE